MRGWPHRPTHALATSRTTGTNPPEKNQNPSPAPPQGGVQPLPRRHAWLAAPPANTCSRNICPDNGNETHQRKTRTPRAAAPAAACVAGRSRGQHMLPQQPSKQTATAPPLNLCRSQAPLGNASREALLRISSLAPLAPPPTLPLPRLPYPSFGRDRSSLLAVFCSCPISNSNCGSSDPAAFSATFACRSACSNNPSPSAARVR